MTRSASTSDSPIVTLENVSLFIDVDVHRPWTLRDLMVRGPRNRSVKSLQILNGVSFQVRAGEKVGILGINGAGKSTLCRCVAGIYRPSSGTIQAPIDIRAVFSSSVGLQPELTGRENARLLSRFLFPTIRESSQLNALVEEALEFSELGPSLDLPYRTYSNGMQARLTLSLISAQPADLFILDEVFDGADQFFREKISERMINVLEQSGAALFVSHSQDQIRRVCNRLILLDRGQVSFDGDVETGLHQYMSRRSQSAPALQ